MEAETTMTWEKLHVTEPKHEFTYGTIFRCKVPGGWLINLFWSTGHDASGVTMTFYPDPDHLWNGASMPE